MQSSRYVPSVRTNVKTGSPLVDAKRSSQGMTFGLRLAALLANPCALPYEVKPAPRSTSSEGHWDSVGPAGLPQVWRPGDHQKPGYIPFDLHDSKRTAEMRARIRRYIVETDIERRTQGLKEWRQRTGHKGIRACAHRRTIEYIAQRNPKNMEDLLACPGVTEMLVDIAGHELLTILSRS